MKMNEVSTYKECKHKTVWGETNEDKPLRFKEGDFVICRQCDKYRTVKRQFKERA